jgi:hypothetical protein
MLFSSDTNSPVATSLFILIAFDYRDYIAGIDIIADTIPRFLGYPCKPRCNVNQTILIKTDFTRQID